MKVMIKNQMMFKNKHFNFSMYPRTHMTMKLYLQVYNIQASPVKDQWRRKEFLFGTQATNIKIKLWDGLTDLLEPEMCGKMALVKNLALDRYGGRNTLSSTPETELIVSTFFKHVIFQMTSKT